MASQVTPPIGCKLVVERADLQALFDVLQAQGYCTIGPTLRDGVIVLDEIRCVEDLPAGWTDEQEGGTYRIRRRSDAALFGYSVGPRSWKRYLHPPEVRLWRAVRSNGRPEIVPEERDTPKYAFMGVRACDLHAIQVLDRVLMNNGYNEPLYTDLRQKALIIGVNCEQAASTCFCVSMEAGPEIRAGYDLTLSEVLDGDAHYFVVDVGSERGAALLFEVPHREANADEVEIADCRVANVARAMGRAVDTEGLRDLLYRNLEHPHWDEVAARCLTCGNCTMVCPTCFCTTVEDVTDLNGDYAERWRKADSCFSVEFSHIYGGSVRASARARYRQWLTHKMATWVDQFGSCGCVGCGRCITWCPVGIDITEEVRAIRASEAVHA